jgi:hypothetical protein
VLNGQSATINGLRELIRAGTADREVADEATALAAERGRASVALEKRVARLSADLVDSGLRATGASAGDETIAYQASAIAQLEHALDKKGV